MKTPLLPFLIIGLVGLTAVGASVYIMKGSGTHPQPQVAATDQAPPSQPAPTPPPPLPSETTDQSPPPAPTQTAVTPPPSIPGQPPGPGQGRGAGMQRMFDQLGLTDAQKQQIAQIRQTVTDRQQRREAIKNVLTPDQQTKWEQLRAQMRPNWGGPRDGGSGGGAPNNPGGNGQSSNAAPTATPAPPPPTPGAGG